MNARPHTDAALDDLLTRYPAARQAPQLVGAESAEDTEVAAYRRLLRAHDWAYHYTDHHATYAAGRSERMHLEALQRRLDPTFAIWNSIAPEGYHGSPAGEVAAEPVNLLLAVKALIDAADASLDRSGRLQRAKANAYTAWVQAGGERRHG